MTLPNGKQLMEIIMKKFNAVIVAAVLGMSSVTTVVQAHQVTARIDKVEVRLDTAEQGIRDTQNAAEIANKHADRLDVRADQIEKQAGVQSEQIGRVEVRTDALEEGQRVQDKQNAVTDKRSINNSVRIDKTEQGIRSEQAAREAYSTGNDARVKSNSAKISNHETRLAGLEEQTASKFRNIDKRFSDMDDHIDAGLSAVSAMANIPQVTDSQKFAVGAGVGARGNQSAVAVGFSARASDNVVVKASVAGDSQQKWTVGGGLSYGW